MRVSHAKVSSKPDKSDATLVRPSDWNAEHVVDTGNLVIVTSASDLPAAVGGVITLESGMTYMLAGDIDLAGDRIVCDGPLAIVGGSSETCSLSSAGLSDPLITSAYGLPMRNISITAAHALNLVSADPQAALNWAGVNFVNCETVGTIAGYGNVIANYCAFINSANLTIDTYVNTASFFQCVFDGRAGQTSVKAFNTLTVGRRIRFAYCALVVGPGEVGIDADPNAPAEGFILDSVNFSGGGSYVEDMTSSDNRARFTDCRGIVNSAQIAFYSMAGNAVATDLTGTAPAKVAGTTTDSGITQKFTHTSNRATYSGALTRTFKITAQATCTSGNTNQVTFYIAKNGAVIPETASGITTSGSGKAENVGGMGIVELSAGEYVEVWVSNASGKDVTVIDLSVIVEALN